MAQVTRTNIGNNHDKISVSLQQEDYLPQFNKTLKEQAQKANIPGFRKGKVPAGMLKKMYGPALFQDEVVKSAYNEMEKYLIENKIEFLAQPMPSQEQSKVALDMNEAKDYTFDFEIALVPDLDLHILKDGTSWTKYAVEVSEEMVDEEVKRFQYKEGPLTHPDTITNEDNVLYLKFNELDASENILDGGITKEVSLLLKYFTADGQKAFMNAEKNLQVKMPLDKAINSDVLPSILKDLELNPTDDNHKAKIFSMQLENIGLVEKAAIDEALFEKAYPQQNIATEEDFRNRIKEDIKNYWNTQTKNYLHNEIFERLVHETALSLPNDFLKNWLLRTEEKYKSMEEVEAQYPSFEHGVRWELITKKIVEENNIDVDKNEIEHAVKMQLIQYFGGNFQDLEQEEWVGNFVKKQMQNKEIVDKTYRELLNQKLFTFLESQIKIDEKNISVDEFIKLPPSHHHHH